MKPPGWRLRSPEEGIALIPPGPFSGGPVSPGRGLPRLWEWKWTGCPAIGLLGVCLRVMMMVGRGSPRPVFKESGLSSYEGNM